MITRIFPALLLGLLVATPLAHATESTGDSGFVGTSYSARNGVAHNLRNMTTLPEFESYDSANRWNDVKAADLLVALKKFNGINGSPALRDIWRDVLLGDFSDIAIKDASEETALMAQRLHILNGLGFFDEALRLYEQAAKQQPVAETLASEGIKALALSGSADGACLETMMAAQHLAGDTWIQDAALCTRYFGQSEASATWFDRVKDKSDGFKTVYEALGQKGSGTIKAGLPPLWQTLLLAKGATLSPELLKKASPSGLAAIAVNKHVDLTTRLAAASRAADAGTIGWDRLRKLYEAKHETDADVATITTAMNAGETLPQSDLFAAARFTFEGNARARVVQTAIEQLRPRTNIKGHVYGWIVDKLTLQPERIQWFAPRGYALMMATNRAASAKIYYEAGHLENSTLSIIEALEEDKPWPAASQETWRKAMATRFNDSAAGRTNKAFSLVKAFDNENKLALLDKKNVKNDATSKVTFLRDSVRNGGHGLTLVTGLNRLGSAKQVSQLSTDEIDEIMKNFAQEGLFGPRKKIALEILLQSVL